MQTDKRWCRYIFSDGRSHACVCFLPPSSDEKLGHASVEREREKSQLVGIGEGKSDPSAPEIFVYTMVCYVRVRQGNEWSIVAMFFIGRKKVALSSFLDA